MSENQKHLELLNMAKELTSLRQKVLNIKSVDKSVLNKMDDVVKYLIDMSKYYFNEEVEDVLKQPEVYRNKLLSGIIKTERSKEFDLKSLSYLQNQKYVDENNIKWMDDKE